MTDDTRLKQRQAIYWHLIGSVYNLNDAAPSFTTITKALVDQLDLPQAILDSSMSLEVLLHRYPKLQPHFDACQALMTEAQPPIDGEIDLRATLAYAKMLLNVFGPDTCEATCSAAQYSQWCNDVAALEACFGYGPGELRQGQATGSASHEGTGASGHGISGRAPRVGDEQLREELVAMESDLIQRMDIREVLKDDRLAARLTPTLPLVEQLLYDKSNLSGPALQNAKRLIKAYVDDLAAVLKKEVVSASTGRVDRSVLPKRIFRNLDIKRTVWKNLTNYNTTDNKLYVDQLFYRFSQNYVQS